MADALCDATGATGGRGGGEGPEAEDGVDEEAGSGAAAPSGPRSRVVGDAEEGAGAGAPRGSSVTETFCTDRARSSATGGGEDKGWSVNCGGGGGRVGGTFVSRVQIWRRGARVLAGFPGLTRVDRGGVHREGNAKSKGRIVSGDTSISYSPLRRRRRRPRSRRMGLCRASPLDAHRRRSHPRSPRRTDRRRSWVYVVDVRADVCALR